MMVILRNPSVLYHFHARKDVAALKEMQPAASPRGTGEFPRPKGRGRIEGAEGNCLRGEVCDHFHARKDVAALKGVAPRRKAHPHPEFPRPKGRGRIEGTAWCIVASIFERQFPRPKGRGRIEGRCTIRTVTGAITNFHARKDVAALKAEDYARVLGAYAPFPRPKGRGRIEGLSTTTIWSCSVSFPRPKGRGRIEG